MSAAPGPDRWSRRLRRLAEARLAVLAEALELPADGDLFTTVTGRLDTAGNAEYWLALAVLLARMPTQDEVIEARRVGALYGSATVVDTAIRRPFSEPFSGHRRRVVSVVSRATIVDVDHTSRVAFATGIQRVTRETTARWVRDRDALIVGWTADRSAFRLLSPGELHQALTGAIDPSVRRLRWRERTIIVPWDSTYLLPELNVEERSIGRLASLARFSRNSTAAITFDAIPITTSETVDTGMAAKFSSYLAALKWFDRVVVISAAAAGEYAGWKRMLTGTGIPGPAVSAVLLPAVAPDVIEPGAADSLVLPSLPLVLCVGSHEPRKNHLAVLHAAELLWREGLEFQLVFVGGNAWGSESFESRVGALAAAGRPVRSAQAVSDVVLRDLYQRAAFSVFPSVNEGFGLPVAESLSVGTPVVTSGFGSMAEIAAGGGALLVDPRNDHDLARGLRTLLTDDTVLSRLRAEARARPARDWDAYAAEAWAALTD